MMYGRTQPYQTWRLIPKIVSTDNGNSCGIHICVGHTKANALDHRYNYNIAFHTGMQALETESLDYVIPPEDAAKLADIFRNPGKYASAVVESKAKSDKLFK